MKNKGRLDRFMLAVWYFWMTVQLQKSLLIYINWKQLKFNLYSHRFKTGSWSCMDLWLSGQTGMPSFCIQPAEDTMTAVFSSSWTVSWLWPQNSLTSVLSVIPNDDDDPRSLAAHGNNHLWKGQGLCRWSHLFLVWFLGVIREVDSAGCDPLHSELVWDGESSISLLFLGGRRWNGTGQQNETTTSIPVGGCSLWPGEGRVKEGIRNQETTFIPKVALRLKPAGQTLNPTRQQDSILTWQKSWNSDPLTCTNTDCRSNIQAQLWIFSQAKPLLYVIFKTHEPPTLLDPPQKHWEVKQILLEYFITLCMRRALLKSLHYCSVLTNSLCDMHKEDQIFANLRTFFCPRTACKTH